jgi:hypothetical protein
MKRIKEVFVKLYNYGILPFAIFLFAYNLHYADNIIKFLGNSILYPLFFALLFFLYAIVKLAIINLTSYRTAIMIYKNTDKIGAASKKIVDFNWENIKKIMWFGKVEFLSKSEAKNRKEEIIEVCKTQLESKDEYAELLAIFLDDELFYENQS